MAETSDITKTGPKALRGVRNPDLYTVEENPISLNISDIERKALEDEAARAIRRNYNTAHGHIGYEGLSSPRLYKPENVPLDSPLADYGDSKYDKGLLYNATAEDIQNQRAYEQPWYAKISNGIAKGTVIAGTTFADGVVGTFAGIANVLFNLDEINSFEDAFHHFISNPVSVELQKINEWSEKVLPNYYNTEEQNTPWWNNIFTANFIGDKFIKNLGFIIGAAYSGRIAAGVIGRAMGLNEARNAFKGVVTTASGKVLKKTSDIAKAYKSGDAFMDGVQITKDLGEAAKQLTRAEYGLRTLAAINAAMGEGRIEAVTNSQQYFDYHKQLLDDKLNEARAIAEQQLFMDHPEYFEYVREGDEGKLVRRLNKGGEEKLAEIMAPAQSLYNSSMEKLAGDRAKMANRIFASNVALLTASNLWSYGKFLSGGFNTGRKASKIAKAIETVNGKKVLNEDAIRMKYLKAASVPLMEANEEMAQSAFAEITGLKYASELNSFYGAKLDPDAEEQTIDWMEAISQGLGNTYGNAENWEEGFLGGLMGGMGMPHISMRKNDSGKRRPKLTLEGELYDNIREARALRKEALGALEYTNNRLKDPEFLNYYQGHIRHTKYQNDMEEALSRGDNFSYKNAESSQFVSDAIMFDRAGRIQDLYDTIEEAGNVTLEDVSSIRQQVIKEDGSPSIYDSMSDQQVVDHIQKQAQDAKDRLDSYIKISNDLKTLYGEDITPDNLDELTWMMTQINDWEKRTKSIMGDLRSTIKDKINVINTRFGIDISAELDNIETLLESTVSPDNSVIDQINRIINDKNITIEEGRKRIEELIKAKEIERGDSELKLEREIQHIRKKARLKREALNTEYNEALKEKQRDTETKERLYKAYLQELNRLTDELNEAINKRPIEKQKHAEELNRKSYYPQAITDVLRQKIMDAFEDYYKRAENLDESLKYAEETLLNRMTVEMSRYEGKRGQSSFERSKESFARNRQKTNSEALFSQIVALKKMLESNDYAIINPLNVKQIAENLQDLIKLYAARVSFIDKFTSLSEHPELFTKEGQAIVEKVTKEIKESTITDTLNKMSDVDTVNDLKKYLEPLNDEDSAEILKRFSEKGEKEKELVENFNKLEDYAKSLGEVIASIPEPDIATSLVNIVQDAYDSSNTKEEMQTIMEAAIPLVPKETGEALKKVMSKASKNSKTKKVTSAPDSTPAPQKPKKKSRLSRLYSSPNEQNPTSAEDSQLYAERKKKTPKKEGDKEESEPVSSVTEFEKMDNEELKEFISNPPSSVPKEELPKVQKLAGSILKQRTKPEGDNQAEGTNSEDNNKTKEESAQPVLRSWYHTKYNFNELKDRDIRRAERYDSPVVDALDTLGAFDFVDEGHLGTIFQYDPKVPIHYVKVKDKRLKDVIVLAVEITPEIAQYLGISPTTAFIAQDDKKYQAVGALGFNKTEEAVTAYNNIKEAVESSYSSSGPSSSKNVISHSYLGMGGRENTVLVEKTPISLSSLNEGDEFFGPNNTPMTLIQKLGNDEYLVVKKGESTQYIIGPTANSQEWVRSKPEVFRVAKNTQTTASTPDYYVYPDATNEIQHIYSGRMVKTTNEDAPRQKSLKEVTAEPVLGVYYGPGTIPKIPLLSAEEEVVPLNSNNANPRDGSVWLMSKEADGRWYAKAVKVKRFTAEEYDMEEYYDTPIMRRIREDVMTLLDDTKSDVDRALAKYDLMEILYFPEGLDILFNEDVVSIKGVANNIGAGMEMDEKIQEFLNVLQSPALNLRFQVDSSQLADSKYIKELLDSDILTTDLAMVHNVNASFDLKIPNEDGTLKETKEPSTGHTGRKGVNNSISVRTLTLNGTQYRVNKEGKVIDPEGNAINNTDTIDELNLLAQIEDGEITPEDGNNRLYLGTYSKSGKLFGIIGGHVYTGLKLKELRDKAKKKNDNSKKRAALNTLFEGLQETDEGIGMDPDLISRYSNPEPKNTPKKETVNTSFKVGDNVRYEIKGKRGKVGDGVITAISSNGKLATVQQSDGKERKYSLSLLTLLEESSNDTEEDTGELFEPVSKEEEASILKELGYDVAESNKPVETLSKAEAPKKEEFKAEPKKKELKKKPLAIGEVFNKNTSKSVEQLKEAEANPSFDRLVRVNRKALQSLGFTKVSQVSDYIREHQDRLPTVESIKSQEDMETLLDQMKYCIGK